MVGAIARTVHREVSGWCYNLDASAYERNALLWERARLLRKRLPAIQFRTSCRSQPSGRPWNLALAGNLPANASSSSTQRGRWVIRATSCAESRSWHGGGPSLTHLESTTSSVRTTARDRVSEVRPVPIICSPCKVWFPTIRNKISLGQEHFMRRQTRQHGYRGKFGRLSPGVYFGTSRLSAEASGLQ